jgi:hypothetical protein
MDTQRKRLELVRELALGKTYNRTHTPTGVHRRPADGPPDTEPDLYKTGTRRRLSNLKPRGIRLR